MRSSWHYFATATRFALIEHARNRFAMLLVAVFVPIWISLAHLIISDAPVLFRLRATDEVLHANGNQLTQISGALNAVTLIVGFMMFAATFKSGAFDRRLAMAGYPRSHLVGAKIAALVIASAIVAVYATAVTRCYWQPAQLWPLAAGLFSAAMTYGAIGVALGALLRTEVEGMFTIVMISMTDVSLQNPIPNPAADSDLISVLPSYGAMQASTGGGFSNTALPQYLALQLAWFAGAAALGFLIFHRRTRTHSTPRDARPSRDSEDRASNRRGASARTDGTVTRLVKKVGASSWGSVLMRLVVVRIDTALLHRTQGRASIGRIFGWNTALLTTTGRRSGRRRSVPLLVFPHQDGYVVAGSNSGRPRHPGWSANLLADPNATLTYAGHTFPVTTRILCDDERAEAWARFLDFSHGYQIYADRSGRALRLFVLQAVHDDHRPLIAHLRVGG